VTVYCVFRFPDFILIHVPLMYKSLERSKRNEQKKSFHKETQRSGILVRTAVCFIVSNSILYVFKHSFYVLNHDSPCSTPSRGDGTGISLFFCCWYWHHGRCTVLVLNTRWHRFTCWTSSWRFVFVKSRQVLYWLCYYWFSVVTLLTFSLSTNKDGHGFL